MKNKEKELEIRITIERYDDADGYYSSRMNEETYKLEKSKSIDEAIRYLQRMQMFFAGATTAGALIENLDGNK